MMVVEHPRPGTLTELEAVLAMPDGLPHECVWGNDLGAGHSSCLGSGHSSCLGVAGKHGSAGICRTLLTPAAAALPSAPSAFCPLCRRVPVDDYFGDYLHGLTAMAAHQGAAGVNKGGAATGLLLLPCGTPCLCCSMPTHPPTVVPPVCHLPACLQPRRMGLTPPASPTRAHRPPQRRR